jgi:hypothetical protein
MNRKQRDQVARRFSEDKEVDEAIRAAVKQAVEDHFKKGEPIVVWQDGKAVWIQPNGDGEGTEKTP